MTIRVGTVVVCALCAVVVASGTNEIRVWDGDPNQCDINQGQRWVKIFSPGTYKFEATDPNNAGGLGDIDHITVDANCPAGTVDVYVVRDPNEVGGDPNQPGVL